MATCTPLLPFFSSSHFLETDTLVYRTTLSEPTTNLLFTRSVYQDEVLPRRIYYLE